MRLERDDLDSIKKAGGNWLEVKLLQLSSIPVHIVTRKDDTWVSSAEISLLQPGWRAWDLLERSLKRKKREPFQQERVGRQEELWSLLEEAGLGGLVDKEGGQKEEIVMYTVQAPGPP